MIGADVAYAVAVWVEMFLYGIYTSLFVAAVSVMLKRRSSSARSSISRWVFLIATIVMFIIATFDLVVQLYRYLRAFILVVDPEGFESYIWDSRRWDNVAVAVLLCLMTWLGDALVIYRCYFVWRSNIWVIMLPALLLVCAIGLNACTLYWFTHPFNLDPKVGVQLLNTIYPIAFVQNVMTTGLITLKIWKQYRVSRASSVVDRSSQLSLIRILRIIVESAMIYTLQLLLLIILYFREDNFQIILQAAVIPSIGIVFVLISVRVHVARSSTFIKNGISILPAWLEDGEDDSRLELDQDESSPGIAVTFRVSSEKLG